jgi:Secretion system C-terminal sorting domain
MKRKLLLLLVVSLAMVSVSNAQYSQIIRHTKAPNKADVQAHVQQLLQSVTADDDTIHIADAGPGIFVATINGDTTAGAGRTNPNRVYAIPANTIETMNEAINVYNPTGTLTIVGEHGGTKPVIVMTGVNGVDPGTNTVVGSLKLDNIHMQSIFTNDGNINDNLWACSTALGLPQSVIANDCLFEFCSLATFACDGYTSGAKFRFTNCYFRNMFNPNQWWGGRVFYCKRAIDTVWVENCTVTDGGMIFLQSNALCKFAYYNHNTIINSNQSWQVGAYYWEGYWVNNLFINQNWVGEDYPNEITPGGVDPDPGMLEGTISLDTITVQRGIKRPPQITIQPNFLNADSSINEALCGLNNIKALVANNVLWTDTVLLEPYYKNKQVGSYGPYGTAFIDTCPSSWIGWTSPPNPPYPVVNIPNIWMNSRTAALFSGIYDKIMQRDNHVNVQIQTVTPAIADAATADQMARWNAEQWAVPGFTSSTNNILHSKYIIGDYDPTTIPGYKTEDGSGITKFTDLNENFSQAGTPILSTIDNLPIGALIWDDARLAAYNSADEFRLVIRAYPPPLGVEIQKPSSALPQSYELSQNYPNPFNPTTTISFSLPQRSYVSLKVFDIMGRELATIASEELPPGNHSRQWNASAFASGVYFYRLAAKAASSGQTASFTETKRLLLLK